MSMPIPKSMRSDPNPTSGGDQNLAVYPHSYETRDSIVAEHGKFLGDVSASNIRFVHVIALEKITSRNDFHAESSQLGIVEVKYNIKVLDSKARKVESLSGDIEWKNQAKPDEAVESIKAKKNIVIARLTCSGNVESESGELTATYVAAKKILAKYDITFYESSARSVESLSGKIKWKNQAKPAEVVESIKAKMGIELERLICSGNIESESDSIKATYVTAKKILAKYDITFIDSSARSVQSLSGKIEWKNQAKPVEVVESIKAKNGIKLERVTCSGNIECESDSITATDFTAQNILSKYTMILSSAMIYLSAESQSGNIEATDCTLQKVKANKAIVLTNSIAEEVISISDQIKMTHTKPHVAVLKSATAKYDIDLHNIDVLQSVTSESGSIKTYGGFFKSILAKNDIKIVDSTVETAVSTSGEITIENKGSTLVDIGQLDAKYNISVVRIRSLKKISSSSGSISARHSELQEIETKQKIYLQSTKCKSVFLTAYRNEKVIVDIPESIIDGNLIIDVQNENPSSMGSVSIAVLDNIFSITVSQLSDLNAYSSTFKEGMVGTINGNPYVYRNGKFVTLGDSRKETKPTEDLHVEIRGGTINGSVIFQNGTGKYTLLNDAVVKGITKG